jgi:hypothetical protein
MKICEDCGLPIDELNESQPVCPGCGSTGDSDYDLDFDELGLDDAEAGLPGSDTAQKVAGPVREQEMESGVGGSKFVI